LRVQGHYDQALSALTAIAEEYPGVARPYLEMLDIYATVLHDYNKCRDIYEAGINLLQDKDERQALEKFFADISADYQ